MYYPEDDGAALATAIRSQTVMIYSDGTVDEGCGAHAYTLQTPCDTPKLAIVGAAPTWGDPATISSLRAEHFGALAGLLWTWILVQKYHVTEGEIQGAVDNLTVVNRLNEGIDEGAGHKKHLNTDIDVWMESAEVMSCIPIKCHLRHVKGHQDDMYKKGVQGPLTRDAFWNVHMDLQAEKARLSTPTESKAIFGLSPATYLCKGQPIHTKIKEKIPREVLAPPLQDYIQKKEEWDDETFEAVDWRTFETCMNKLTIHKRINVAKYVFNWQNTG